MTGKGPIVQGAVCRLLTHKDHAVKMVYSIIKETDLDPCTDQTMEDLGVLSLFDLSWVCSLKLLCCMLSLHSFPNGGFDSGIGVDKGVSRLARCQ